MENIFFNTSNYIRINDTTLDCLYLDKVSETLVDNADELYRNNHAIRLDRFFEIKNESNKEYKWWQKMFVGLSKKLDDIANR